MKLFKSMALIGLGMGATLVYQKYSKPMMKSMKKSMNKMLNTTEQMIDD